MPRKWIAVRASAGLAIAGSLLTFAIGLLMPISMALAPPPSGPGAPPFPLMAVGIIMAVIFSAFALWGVLTGIAIFRRRGWARISIMLFGILLAIMGFGGSLAAIFMPIPQQEGVDPRIMTGVRFGMAALYLLLAAIGIWWLVLFNRKITRQYFEGINPREDSGARPLSLSIIGWYLLLSSILMAASAVFKIPAFVFGGVVTGWGALGVYSLFTVVQLYLGTGILHLQEHARLGGIAYFVVVAINSLLSMQGLDAKMEVMRRELPKLFPGGMALHAPQPAWVFGLMGTALVIIPIWFLVRRRAAFAQSAPAGMAEG
ncbi:MAG: hypothetical protein ABI806_17775 [Candidatus Solibacter sp.]